MISRTDGGSIAPDIEHQDNDDSDECPPLQALKIFESVSLKNHSTMRLGGEARYLTNVTTVEEVKLAVAWAEARKLPFLIIGHGSNIVWRDEGFQGLILVNCIPGYEIRPDPDPEYCEDHVLVAIGAGEEWDSVVRKSVEAGLCGIEALSLISGTTGATPIQNVGAYGQEVGDTLVSVEAYDVKQRKSVSIAREDCGLDYRTSYFKTQWQGRYLITGMMLKLKRYDPSTYRVPSYHVLQEFFQRHPLSPDELLHPIHVREAVIALRSSKLPDPSKIPNCGSFFMNPHVSLTQLRCIQDKDSKVPFWPHPEFEDTVKLSAGWLINHSFFTDQITDDYGVETWPHSSLVVVNRCARSTDDLIRFCDNVIVAVRATFGVELRQEPNLLPSISETIS